jgi:hypothetical protein
MRGFAHTGGMTEQPRPTLWRRADDRASRAYQRIAGTIGRTVSQVPDEHLVGTTALGGGPQYDIEMQRRLKDAVEALTAETVRSRESSEKLTGQLDASIAGLTAETVRAAQASDRAARRLVWLTVVLVVLTAVLVALTVVLAVRS